jgi:hypothetical protein
VDAVHYTFLFPFVNIPLASSFGAAGVLGEHASIAFMALLDGSCAYTKRRVVFIVL